jgi:hypothetical protein
VAVAGEDVVMRRIALLVFFAAIGVYFIVAEVAREQYKFECLRQGGEYTHRWGGNCKVNK